MAATCSIDEEISSRDRVIILLDLIKRQVKLELDAEIVESFG
jgi:hypothetical protein